MFHVISNSLSLWRPVESVNPNTLMYFTTNKTLTTLPLSPNIDKASLGARIAVVTGALFGACFYGLNRLKHPIGNLHPALQFVACVAVPAFAKCAYQFEYGRALSVINQKAVKALKNKNPKETDLIYMVNVPSALAMFFKEQTTPYRNPDLLGKLLPMESDRPELLSVKLQSFKEYISSSQSWIPPADFYSILGCRNPSFVDALFNTKKFENYSKDSVIALLKMGNATFVAAVFKVKRIKDFSLDPDFVANCWKCELNGEVKEVLTSLGIVVKK